MRIEFEFVSKYGTFRDALELLDDHGFSDADIEEMKQTKINNWLASVSGVTTVFSDEEAHAAGSSGSVEPTFTGE